jgi:hypothetical protein
MNATWSGALHEAQKLSEETYKQAVALDFLYVECMAVSFKALFTALLEEDYVKALEYSQRGKFLKEKVIMSHPFVFQIIYALTSYCAGQYETHLTLRLSIFLHYISLRC